MGNADEVTKAFQNHTQHMEEMERELAQRPPKKQPAQLVRMLRELEFVFMGICDNGALRLGMKSTRDTGGSWLQFPADHFRFPKVLALVEIEDDEEFESAVMGVLSAG